MLGDLVSTGLGVLGLNWQASPALTELEEVVVRLDAPDGRAVGRLERRDSGHGVDRHLIALLCARERTTNFSPRPRRAAGRAAGR